MRSPPYCETGTDISKLNEEHLYFQTVLYICPMPMYFFSPYITLFSFTCPENYFLLKYQENDFMS